MLHSRSVKNLLQYSVLIRVQDQDEFVESVFGDVNIARFAEMVSSTAVAQRPQRCVFEGGSATVCKIY